MAGEPSSQPVRLWLEFIAKPTGWNWYRAHNASIVDAYLEHRDLAEAESPPERFFMNVASPPRVTPLRARDIVGLVDGDETARFEELFRAHYGRVVAYARRRGSVDADEIAAETFLVAWRRLEAVPGNELPWLLAVARRVLANQRRRSATQERAAAVAAAEPERLTEVDAGLDMSLHRALLQLTEIDRELLTLVAWDGLSTAEAGRVLGLSSVGARVRLHRARRRLEVLLRLPTAKEPRWKTTGSTF